MGKIFTLSHSFSLAHTHKPRNKLLTSWSVGLGWQGFWIPQTVPTLPPLSTLIERAHTVSVTMVTMTSQGWEAQKRPWAPKYLVIRVLNISFEDVDIFLIPYDWQKVLKSLKVGRLSWFLFEPSCQRGYYVFTAFVTKNRFSRDHVTFPPGAALRRAFAHAHKCLSLPHADDQRHSYAHCIMVN